MKRLMNYAGTQDGLLASALIALIVASGFALLHAMAGESGAIGLIAPLFVPA